MTKMMMIENENIRYEFYSVPIRRSNVDDTIVEYRPAYTRIQRLASGLGSTMHSEQFAGRTHEERVKRGNDFYKEMLAKGFKRVSKRSFA